MDIDTADPSGRPIRNPAFFFERLISDVCVVMRYSSTFRRKRELYVIVLVALCLLALLLPRRFTGKLINLVQMIVPVQDAASSAVRSISRNDDGDDETVSRQTFEAIERANVALTHRAVALAARVAELEKDVEILTATRLWNPEGGKLGAKGRLVPARIIVDDLLPWRASHLISAGSLQGVTDGAPVLSRYFTIDEGARSGIQNGMAILLGEALVGVVEQVGTHTARFKLLSDVSVQRKVRIGRLTEQGFVSNDRYYWLVGRGHGVMQIRDARRRDVEAGRIAVKDIVLSDPASDRLPAAMTIGSITAIETDPQNPLLSVLTVESELSTSELRRVFVYDPGP